MSNYHLKPVPAVEFVDQLDRSSEFELVGRRFAVTTRSGSRYVVDDVKHTIAKNGERPRPGFVQGATFGGSMLMSGRLLVDSYMEFVMSDEGQYGKTYTSSLIVAIELLP